MDSKGQRGSGGVHNKTRDMGRRDGGEMGRTENYGHDRKRRIARTECDRHKIIRQMGSAE
jgi:hypothetical protein